MSRWRIRVRSVPKAAEEAYRNKDRVRVGRPGHGRLVVGVSDGATQAFGSGDWADLLVGAWGDRTLSTTRSNRAIGERLGSLASAWRAGVTTSDSVPWFVTAKAARGAHATFLGLELRFVGRSWHWRALAVGDTELFVLDADRALTAAFPIDRSTDFGGFPELIGTTDPAGSVRPGRHIRKSGVLHHCGQILVATDALARCLLAAHEAGHPLWDSADAAARTHDAFAGWVSELRASSRIEDDDTSLVTLERAR